MRIKKSILYLFLLIFAFGCNEKKENDAPVEIMPATVVVGLGKVVPYGGVSNLAAPAAGIVTEIIVSTGDKVKGGDVLMVLDDTDATLRLDEINSSFAAQQKSVESSKILARQGRLALSEIERKLSDSRELYEAGAVSRESLLELENNLEVEKQNQEKLQNDIFLQEAQLRELAAQRTMRNEELKRATLRSPMDGVVLDVLPKKGEAVNKYESYLVLAPDAPLVVLAEIDEMFSIKIAIGQTCTISISGNSEPVATGKISRISPDLKKKSLFADSGQDFQDRRIREIEIALDDDPPLLIDTKVECVVNIN